MSYTPSADELAEVTYLTGVTSDGIVAQRSFAAWNDDSPATYDGGAVPVGKWGGGSLGSSATITYSFTAASNWTATEKAAINAVLDLYSAEAGVAFQSVTSGGSLSFTRGSDRSAEGGARVAHAPQVGSSGIGTIVSGQVSIDTSVAGFGPIGSSFTNYGGYPWTTLIHEVGHALGLGHSGAYDGGDATPLTAYDSRAYTVMSYLDPNDTALTSSTPVGQVEWGSEVSDNHYRYAGEPTTLMPLDILAVQRLYGGPASSALSGGQVFGFNSNIAGDIRPFFDFSVDPQPVVTLYDSGTNNTLDLSGFLFGATVSLVQGSFGSAGGLSKNIGIAYGTRIDTLIGGTGSDVLTGNDDGDTISGGAGSDHITGGRGDDRLYGGDGDDTIAPVTGHDIVDGGDGYDTLLLDRSMASYRIVVGNGETTLTDGDGNSVRASNMEVVRFADQTVAMSSLTTTPDPTPAPTVTPTPPAPPPPTPVTPVVIVPMPTPPPVLVSIDADVARGEVYRLYETAYGRAPDAGGFDGWVKVVQSGNPLSEVVQAFVGSAEFAARFGSLDNAGFVAALYQTAFHHGADAAGQAYFTAALDAGTLTRADMVQSFSEGTEEKALAATAVNLETTVAEVYRLYETAYGRAPDPDGFHAAVAMLKAGGSLASIAQAFAASSEFATHYGALDNGAFVDELYRTALHRAVDPDGRATFVAKLDAGTISRADLVLTISESAEQKAVTAHAVGLETTSAEIYRLYETAYGRTPDADGFHAGVAALDGGATLASVATSIAGSAEFASNYGTLDNAGFIDALYHAAFHRAADPDGRAAFLAALDAGTTTRAGLVLTLSESTEEKSLTDTAVTAGLWTQDEAQVHAALTLLYGAELGRAIDAGGLATFEQAIGNGATTRQIATSIAQSSEFAGLYGGLSDSQYVEALYHNAYHRAADPGGEASFLHELQTGSSRADVAWQIAGSAEHQALAGLSAGNLFG